jgi:two-component system cell cycle sensor histidine kinase/response regulator CckA
MASEPDQGTRKLLREIERLRKRISELEAGGKGGQEVGGVTPVDGDILGVVAPAEWYRSLVETSFDGIFIQRGPKIVYANRMLHRMLGYEPGELIGKDHWLVYAPEFQALTRARGEARMRGENPPSRCEVKLQRKDGSTLEGEIQARLMHFEDGPGIHVWIRDLTEREEAERKRRELEEQLHQARRLEALGTLAGGIAHNFNNLLMAIQGNVSLLLMEMDPRDPRGDRLRAIEEAVRSGAQLTRQVQRFARGEQGETVALDINALVRGACELFAVARKEMLVRQDLDARLRTVRGDRSLLEQVLMNLLVNGGQAMPGGGELLVRTENVALTENEAAHHGVRPGGFVRITVMDSGIGMDQATLQRIFEPFFTTRDVGEGTGLGLSTAYGIVRSHGGFISAESQPGVGSTFKVYLPACDEQVTLEEPYQKTVRGKGTILLVDDEEMILKVGTQMLEALGYRVIQARGGQDALELYRERGGDVDLVLLDMIMPGMGGSQVFRGLRRMNPRARVLLCSGHSPEGEAQEGLMQGCLGFIQKPFRLEDLARTLQETMQWVPGRGSQGP